LETWWYHGGTMQWGRIMKLTNKKVEQLTINLKGEEGL